MEKKTKILIIIAGFRFGVSGGVASVLYNYCSHISSDKFQFDYLALGYQGFNPYRTELEKRGGRLYCAEVMTHGWKRFFQSVNRICSFLRENPGYDIVHVNSGAMRQVLMMAVAARLAGCKAIIVHSHSAMRLSKTRARTYAILKHLFYLCADHYIACSEMAAQSMFPYNIVKRKKWCFLPNAIDMSKFVYSVDIRERVRSRLGIRESELIVGHVGRFNEPKNHKFLIDVFAEILKRRGDAYLLLVGTGDLMDEIKGKAEKLCILDKVIFTGQRTDVHELMQSMDVFVFPSLYEGLGMSVIEAQALGLPTLASDRIPFKETNITDIIRYLPLGDPQKWAEVTLDMIGEKKSDCNCQESVKNAGYDINISSKILEDVYQSMVQRSKLNV